MPEEPPQKTNELIEIWKNSKDILSDRIIINPHAGYFSSQSIEEMRVKASENMLSFLTGNKVSNIVRFKVILNLKHFSFFKDNGQKWIYFGPSYQKLHTLAKKAPLKDYLLEIDIY